MGKVCMVLTWSKGLFGSASVGRGGNARVTTRMRELENWGRAVEAMVIIGLYNWLHRIRCIFTAGDPSKLRSKYLRPQCAR